MKNIPLILYIVLIFLVVSCAGSKKNFETYVSDRQSVSYALPGESRILLENICDTLFKPVVLSQTNGPVKVDVVIPKRGQVEILTKYDTIFKEKTKEVVKTVTKTEVKYRTNWKWIVGALVIGFALGYLRPWK